MQWEMIPYIIVFRLQQKLVESSDNRGSCPKPSYPGNQEFFRGFIIAAQARYILLCCLVCVMLPPFRFHFFL